MSKYGPASAFLLVGGCNVSGETHQMSESVEQLLTKSDGLGDSWDEHLPVGKAKVTLAASGGFYDDAAASTIEAFQDQGATKQAVSYGMAGHTPGAECVLLNGTYAVKFNRLPTVDDLTKAYADHTITGQLYRGKVLHGLTAETTDPGNTEGASSVDNGAATTVSWEAQLHVPALTLDGATSVTATVRHSTDDVTYATLTTFANVTAAGTAEHKSGTGTVNQYRAMTWDFNGAPGAAKSVVPYVALYTA